MSVSWPSTAALVLAAGEGRRFGQPKALVLWRGRPMVRRAVRAACRAGCAPVIVVVGAAGSEVAHILRDDPVVVVDHPGWRAGIGSSLAAGAARVPEDARGVVVMLADQPFVTSGLVRRLIGEANRTGALAVVSRDDHREAPPTWFSRELVPLLRDLEGDQGARVVVDARRDRCRVLRAGANQLADLDTREDLTQLLGRAGSARDDL